MTSEVFSLILLTLTGVLLGLCYDIVRAIRRAISFNIVFIWISDFLYWIVATCTIAYMLLITDDGIISTYEICGLILGAILYYNTLSRLILKIFGYVFAKIIKIFKLFLQILLTPVRFLYKILIGRNVNEQISKTSAKKTGTL